MHFTTVATLGMIYPARGGLVWGQMRGVLFEVRGSTPLRGPVLNMFLGHRSSMTTKPAWPAS